MFTTIILTILLFIIPIISLLKFNFSFKTLYLKKITIYLNKSFLIQIALGIILFIVVKYFLNFNYDSNIFYDTLIETSYYYIVIGIFYYFPCLILLNLITKSWKKNSKN